MATKTNHKAGNYKYYKLKRCIAHKINEHGARVPVYRYFYGRSKGEALQKYSDFLRGSASPSGDILFMSAFNQWVHDKFEVSDRSPGTKTLYLSSFYNHVDDLHLENIKLADIDSQSLQKAYNNMGCGASTVRNIHKLLRLFFADCLANGLINSDPTSTLVLPKVPKKNSDLTGVEVWPPGDLDVIMKRSQGHRLRFLFVILANTGVRISECLALRYDDFSGGVLTVHRQLQGGEVTELKTRYSVRSIPLSEEVVKELKRHKRKMSAEVKASGRDLSPFVFVTGTGTLYNRQNLAKECKRLYAAWGITPRGFHTYRHTFATRLASSGASIHVVSKILGHSNVAVTGRYYIDVDDEIKRSAISKLSPML